MSLSTRLANQSYTRFGSGVTSLTKSSVGRGSPFPDLFCSKMGKSRSPKIIIGRGLYPSSLEGIFSAKGNGRRRWRVTPSATSRIPQGCPPPRLGCTTWSGRRCRRYLTSRAFLKSFRSPSPIWNILSKDVSKRSRTAHRSISLKS